jgi:hypothetical protein
VSHNTTIIDATLHTFRQQKTGVERAIAQIQPEQIFIRPGTDKNSIAVLMKHVGGNLHSRWRDFLTTDGEKPDRDRDGEFEKEDSCDDIMERWNRGWATLEATFGTLTMDDLDRTITIRGEVIPVPLAIQRSLAHTAQHAGQIIMLAKIHAGDQWRTLSMPLSGRDH